jgi:CheY-like chemotaxis protein
MREKSLILIVDDEANFLEIASTRLQAGGYDVATARNEKEAITQAEKLVPDLILMDINMPGGTGTDAALSIKQNPKLKDVKIAFLSSLKKPWPAFGMEERKSLSQELGMEDFLDKGEDMDHLVEKVQALLEKE